LKVCWQVTGIRRDPWAEAHRIRVEKKKTRIERGTYRHPEVYGKPAAGHGRGGKGRRSAEEKTGDRPEGESRVQTRRLERPPVR
jgi:hypothetical protein